MIAKCVLQLSVHQAVSLHAVDARTAREYGLESSLLRDVSSGLTNRINEPYRVAGTSNDEPWPKPNLFFCVVVVVVVADVFVDVDDDDDDVVVDDDVVDVDDDGKEEDDEEDWMSSQLITWWVEHHYHPMLSSFFLFIYQ